MTSLGPGASALVRSHVPQRVKRSSTMPTPPQTALETTSVVPRPGGGAEESEDEDRELLHVRPVPPEEALDGLEDSPPVRVRTAPLPDRVDSLAASLPDREPYVESTAVVCSPADLKASQMRVIDGSSLAREIAVTTTIPVEVVEDEHELFSDAQTDDDDRSFVSLKLNDERGTATNTDSEARWTTETETECDTEVEVDDQIVGVFTEEDDDDEEDEDEDEDDGEEDEGRKLTETEKHRQEREDVEVERVLQRLNRSGAGGMGGSTPALPTSGRAAADRRNTNMASAKVLEISTIESRISTQGSTLAARYRERMSMTEEQRISRKSSFNPKVSSTARLLAKGMSNDFDQTTVMFGGTDAMLDYIEESENDANVYNDPVKRSMKFAACRALIGDLLEESNVYSSQAVADEDEE